MLGAESPGSAVDPELAHLTGVGLMPIKQTCPVQNKPYNVPDTVVGKQVRCPFCQTIYVAGAAGNHPTATPASGAAPAKPKTVTAPSAVPTTTKTAAGSSSKSVNEGIAAVPKTVTRTASEAPKTPTRAQARNPLRKKLPGRTSIRMMKNAVPGDRTTMMTKAVLQTIVSASQARLCR